MPKKAPKLVLDLNKISNDLQNSPAHKLTFVSYPKLCSYLGLRVLKNNSKIAQLKQLSTILKFEINEDKSISITDIISSKNVDKPIDMKTFISEVYDTYISTKKNKTTSKALKQLTEYTILSFLLYHHDFLVKTKKPINHTSCVVSMSYLAEMLGYITLKYKYFYTHPKELSSKTNIALDTVYEFFEKTNDLYNRYILESLNFLEKYKMLAVSQKFYGIEYSVSDIAHEEVDYTSFGDAEVNLLSTVSQKCRPLTDDEISKLLSIERESFFEAIQFFQSPNETPEQVEKNKQDFLNELKSQNISLMYFLFKHRLDKKYYAIRHKKLIEELHLTAAYKAYDIVYDYDSIFSSFQYTFKDLQKQGIISNFYDASSMIIDNSSTKLLDNTKKRHEKEKNNCTLDTSVYQNKNQSSNLDETIEKERLSKLIDRETKEFKQVLDLLIYQQKNQQSQFKNVAKDNTISEKEFEEQFDKQLESINKKNTNFKKRNSNLYK